MYLVIEGTLNYKTRWPNVWIIFLRWQSQFICNLAKVKNPPCCPPVAPLKGLQSNELNKTKQDICDKLICKTKWWNCIPTWAPTCAQVGIEIVQPWLQAHRLYESLISLHAWFAHLSQIYVSCKVTEIGCQCYNFRAAVQETGLCWILHSYLFTSYSLSAVCIFCFPI